MVEEYSDEEREEILEQIHEWERDFSKSEQFKTLTDLQLGESESVINFFAEYMYSYHGVGPEQWAEGNVMEECCQYILPRKISAKEAFFEAIAPVLSAFFNFLKDHRLLDGGSDLAARVEGIDHRIQENASDPGNWGMAKSLVMSAKEAGVDPTNEEEMGRFVVWQNIKQSTDGLKGLLEEVGEILQEKAAREPESQEGSQVGRNDPCPCGSGKKYKYCCGR